MNTMIMFPSNATSLILGRRLINAEHNLALYCPNEVHTRQAATIPDDLRIASLGLGITVEVKDTLDNLDTIDFLLFPTLDMLPHNKRSEFGQMCQDLFRSLKSDTVKFKSGVSVIFGGNLSGLISAKEFGEVFPELRKSTYVTSSIYNTSRQIFGDTQDRAFPMIRQRGTRKLVFTGSDESELLMRMKGAWDIDAYSNAGSSVILDVITGLTDMGGDLSGLEIIGRFPTETEEDEYEISPSTPVWLSTRDDLSLFTSVMINRLKSMSEWMESGYNEVLSLT